MDNQVQAHDVDEPASSNVETSSHGHVMKTQTSVVTLAEFRHPAKLPLISEHLDVRAQDFGPIAVKLQAKGTKVCNSVFLQYSYHTRVARSVITSMAPAARRIAGLLL